jgi:hypothetical protein
MKIPLFSLTALSLYLLTGCLQIQPLNKTSISQNTSECPNQPTTVLETNNVKTVSLSSQTITESGMVTNNKSLGYTFTGKTGNKLVYQTNENICIWVYTPDNQLINNPILPVDGKYIIQIAAMQGATTFDLGLQLEDNTQVVNLSSSPTPVETTQVTSPTLAKNTNAITTPKLTANCDVVNIESGQLALRFTPNGTAKAGLNNGDHVILRKRQSIWAYVTVISGANKKVDGLEGWVNSNYLSCTNNAISNSDNSDNSDNVDRPSPAKAIENYYTMINNQQYDSAWDIYPTAVKEDKELHPNGYDSFVEWWTKVNYVTVNNISIASENNDSAIVNFRSRYEMKNGKSIPVRLKFYLVWDQENETWYVTKIKHNN